MPREPKAAGALQRTGRGPAAGLLLAALAGSAGEERAGDAAPPRALAEHRVASRTDPMAKGLSAPALPSPSAALSDASLPPVERALKVIADCQARFARVEDYSCLFVKRERVKGVLTSQHEMDLKARTNPLSFYMKFRRPYKGREAVFVAGRYDGKVLAHDVGLFKVLAGTMHLDPRGAVAMEGTRHPITEAGIGALVETVARHWQAELTPAESVVRFQSRLRVGRSECTMIESVHPQPHPGFLFHKVCLYVDHAHGLPIRFEAYDWPRSPGAAPELVEEYTYLDLKTNLGLTDRDFDPDNPAYAFGRF